MLEGLADAGMPRCLVIMLGPVVRGVASPATQVHYLRDSAVSQVIVMDHGRIVARGRYECSIYR